jgi:hypothetical protein
VHTSVRQTFRWLDRSKLDLAPHLHDVFFLQAKFKISYSFPCSNPAV